MLVADRQPDSDRDPDAVAGVGFVFALQRLLPGDPLLVMAGEERDPEVLEQSARELPASTTRCRAVLAWLGEVASGDFGVSLRTDEPVLTLIGQKLPVTIQLAIARHAHRDADRHPDGHSGGGRERDTGSTIVASVVALSGLSIPNFWLGIMLILRRLGEAAAGCRPRATCSVFDDPVGAFQTTIMPAFVLGSGLAATLMRHTRSAMLEVLQPRLCPHGARQGPARRARWS